MNFNDRYIESKRREIKKCEFSLQCAKEKALLLKDLNYPENSRLFRHLNFRSASCFVSQIYIYIYTYSLSALSKLQIRAIVGRALRDFRANFADELERMSFSGSFIRSVSVQAALIQKLSYDENSGNAVVRNVFVDGSDSHFAGSSEEKLRSLSPLRECTKCPGAETAILVMIRRRIIEVVSLLYYDSPSSRKFTIIFFLNFFLFL